MIARIVQSEDTSAPTTSLASKRHTPSRHPVHQEKPSTDRRGAPLRRLPLTPHHRQCRLDFCRPRAT
ncbi:hypothetical protein TNCV_1599151 [Trichonephila clavipes]|nr:hypothetical protein TNCV_1599151 [Trichonephila clavipes]